MSSLRAAPVGLILLLMAGCAGTPRTQTANAQAPSPAAAQSPAPKYTKDELTVLDALDGFGDPGQLDVSRQTVAPDSALGFSIKTTFNNDPAAPVHWWSIRTDLPGSVARYDTLEFDLYKESAADGAGLTISLAEPDDNRWVAFEQPLSAVAQGKWTHFSVPRDKMRHWQLADRAFDWSQIMRFQMEAREGRSVYYLDNVRLTGPGIAPMPVFNTLDDGLRPDPSWHEARQPPIPPGGVLFPCDLGVAQTNLDQPISVGLRQSVGSSVSVPLSHFYPVILPVTRGLRAKGILSTYYAQMGNGYAKYFTKRQAWDTNVLGHSLNETPAYSTGWDFQHTYANSHPAVFAAEQQRVDALLQAGLTTWLVADYTLPWYEALWGFSEVEAQAYKQDLAGQDEGLHTRDGQKAQVLHFEDYYRTYAGFYPTPAEVGLKTWQDYLPPKPDDVSDLVISRRTLFLYLRAYEWLKLADRVGRDYKSKGGQGLWIIPNGESTYVSPDYVYLLRSQGIGSLFPEWFGNAGTLAEASYVSTPYLREQADRGGSRLAINVETGATGHSAPYWDWRVAYNAVYEIAAASRADNLDNDFLDEAPYKTMSDPKNVDQFKRFRDGVTKAKAFRQAYAEKPQMPDAQVLCVTDRPTGREVTSTFFDLNKEYALAQGLSRAHIGFRLRDSLDLAGVVNNYRVIVYCPRIPRVGDFEILHQWLAAAPGRILVTHTSVPTVDSRSYLNFDHQVQIRNADGGAQLGLGRITQSDVTRCTVTSSQGPWRTLSPVGTALTLPLALTRCESGETLVDTDGGPLVTRARVGQSQVIYLHFTSTDANDPVVSALNVQAMKAVAETAGVRPLCAADPEVTVQMFRVAGGQSILAWDVPTYARWKFVYQPGIAPLEYAAPDVSRTVRIPAAGVRPWLVYNFWTDSLQSIAPQAGSVPIRLQGAVTVLYYAGPDTPTFRATVAAARKTHAGLLKAGFQSVP